MLNRRPARARGVLRFRPAAVETVFFLSARGVGYGLLTGSGTERGMFKAVPAPLFEAAALALFILILAIAQLPPLLVLLPAIIYVFSAGDSTTVAVAFTIWSIAVSFSDTFLKPLLLGRGVEAPMLVILLGAIGGMIMSGILGLFVGAVVLALGYKLFEAWVRDAEGAEEAAEKS